MSKPHSNQNANLRLMDLSKSFEEAGSIVSIFQDLNVEFKHGEIAAILGKSGSGKTTLLNLISGIDSPDSGEVWIGDILLNNLSEYEKTLIRRNKLGIIFQFFNLLPTLSVLENVALPKELNGKNGDFARDEAKELLKRVGLGDRLNSYPDILSGGEQQRVAIARALINSPDLLLADEPTGNLDDETASEILALLIEVARESEKTMIIATHSNEIINYADSVYSVHGGSLVSK